MMSCVCVCVCVCDIILLSAITAVFMMSNLICVCVCVFNGWAWLNGKPISTLNIPHFMCCSSCMCSLLLSLHVEIHWCVRPWKMLAGSPLEDMRGGR